jgi:ATP-dependent DNA ligase
VVISAIFELKIDGFRSLAYVEKGKCDLVSRNGNTFRNFKDLALWIGENLRVENAVIDGEIACVDDSGRSVFNDLLLRWRECLFFEVPSEASKKTLGCRRWQGRADE